MSADLQTELLESQDREDVTVVHFTRRTILDPMAIEAAGSYLLSLVNDRNRLKLVLDFSRVESATSAMFGKLLSLFRAVSEKGGKLVFCSVDPFLMQIFTICQLPAAISILPDQAAAVASLAEGAG